MTRLTKNSFLLLLILGVSVATLSNDYPIYSLDLNNKDYQLEIADTPDRKSRGLMFRPHLNSDKGMLFLYQRPGNYRIWMKNTRIPLTVLWLDANARLIEKKRLLPCKNEACPTFGVSQKALYIIELAESEFNRFEVGDRFPAISKFVEYFSSK